MRKPDEKVLQALCNLEENPDFKTVIMWFLESSADADEVLRTAEGNILFRAQGASRICRSFCKIASAARENVRKLTK